MEMKIVSKKRVADHGEMYNGMRKVNAMLDNGSFIVISLTTGTMMKRHMAIPT